MTWVFLVLVTALLQAVKDVLLKRVTGHADVLVITFGYCLTTSVFLWLAALSQPFPDISPSFWWALAGSASLGAASLVLYTAGLKHGELSLALPMLTFTPLFLLVASPLILGEFPDTAGLVGIVLIVAGAYALNLGQMRNGLLAPFRALMTAKGPRIMLLVALLWGICANFDKIGLQASSPVFWIAAAFSASALALLPVVLARSKGIMAQFRARPLELAATGALECVSCVCQMYALTMAIVPYVIAVKRLSAVFGVLLGAWIFKERGLSERLFGASLMVAGVFFIAVLG